MKPFEVKLWEGEIPFLKDADTPNRMTFYPIETWYPAPCVVIFPGGAYVDRAGHEGAPIAEFFNSRGMHAAVVDYRVKPNFHPAPLADAQRAIKLCRANAEEWKVDPNRIVTLGFSAGGHLSACCATLDNIETPVDDEVSKQSHIPNGAVLCYPAIDLGGKYVSERCGKNLLGDAYEDIKAEFSLQNRITDKTPKTFIWHTSDDSAADVRNSLLFAEGLREQGIPFEMHIYPVGKHGLGLAKCTDDANAWPDLCADWIINNI